MERKLTYLGQVHTSLPPRPNLNDVTLPALGLQTECALNMQDY